MSGATAPVKPNGKFARHALRDRGMVVATKTVTVKGEDGEPERLKAGQTFVDAGHWLVKSYPELFTRESDAGKHRTKARPRLPNHDAQPRGRLSLRGRSGPYGSRW